MKKRSTKPKAPAPFVDPLEEQFEAPEMGPPELQRAHDGGDHGHRLLSREDVIARHGIDTLHRNEEQADIERQTRGHAQRLRKNHGR